MNYLKIYNDIVERARLENRKKLKKTNTSYVYYENHHIIPRCLGGSDDKENLVLLTAREHFVCHKLLCKIYPENRKIICAFTYMSFGKRYDFISSRDYEYAKKIIIPLFGEKNGRYKLKLSQESLEKMKLSALNRDQSVYRTKEFRLNQSAKTKGENNGMYSTNLYNIFINKYDKETANTMYENWKEKLSNSLKGKPKSEEHRNNIKLGAINRKKFICNHCKKEFDAGNFKQHQNKLIRLKLI